jgi:hypothetical protein
MKIHPVRVELLHPEGQTHRRTYRQTERQTDRQTEKHADLTKLIVAFRNFAIALKKQAIHGWSRSSK